MIRWFHAYSSLRASSYASALCVKQPIRKHVSTAVYFDNSIRHTARAWPVLGNIDREFEFYEFFSFLKFNEFYEFFRLKKIRKKIRNFANHRCLTCFDVLECNVHL